MKDYTILLIEDEKNIAWPVCDTGPDKYDRLLQR